MKLLPQFLSPALQGYLIEKIDPLAPELVLEKAEECLRFLYLSHLTHGAIPVSQAIDDVWHWLILETKEYMALCQKLPAQSYIHHGSDAFAERAFPNKSIDEDTEATRQLEWLVNYVAYFGDMTETNLKHWSFAAALRLRLGLNIDEFNQELRSLIP